MHNIESNNYFQDVFKFLKSKDDNRISFKKLFYYLLAVLTIVITGQMIVNNSDPYKSDTIENEKFIKTELKSQTIIDTISLPIQQSYFKSYFAIKLTDGSIYRLNLNSNENKYQITKNTVIEKKANDKRFEIINNTIRYKFEISELDNFKERIFVFLGSLFLSILGIPLFLKKNELEKRI